MRRLLAISLSLLFLVACGAAGGRAPARSGITGRTVAGPTCPVERVPPLPQCAPRPISVRLSIHRVGSGTTIVVQSGADGRFRVLLAPGAYVVTALARNGSPFPRPPAPRTVRVHATRLAYITVTYDTGIR